MERETHMKVLTIMYHRTSSPRERGSSTQLEVRALLLFCCLVCWAKETFLDLPQSLALTAYGEPFVSLSLANRENNGRCGFLQQVMGQQEESSYQSEK